MAPLRSWKACGHAEGDAVLQAVVALLLGLRRQDLLCHMAGDRFVVLLANTGESQARLLALELQQAVHELPTKPASTASACTCRQAPRW